MTAAYIAAGTAVLGYLGQQDAAGSARGANAQNLQFQQQMYKEQDPFSAGGNRQQYVGQLNQLMQGGPASMAQDPMYQWMQGQGQQAVERQASAAGTGQSGAEKSALMQQQFGTANSYFQQQYQRLSDLSGASSGRTAPMQGMSGSDAYNMSLGGTAATSGLIRGVAGMFGHGSTDTGGMGTGTGGAGQGTIGGTQGEQLASQWNY